MLRFLLILIAAVLAAPAAANLAGDMRVIGDPGKTRFVVDLEKNPEYRVLHLMNPYRLVVDMPNVDFPAPAKPGEGRGLISEYRYGLIAPGKARIVLDLVGPVEIINTFVLDPLAPEPARLVIDLVPTTAPVFEAAAARDRSSQDVASPDPAAPVHPGRPVVVIDPGHGGIDSGAVGTDGLLEKEITLKFALALARQLEAGAAVAPVLTREGDDFVALSDRVAFAKKHRAALFISIHADTVKEEYVRGATVYTLSDNASDALTAEYAARENRADVLAGLALGRETDDDVVDILSDLARRDTQHQSIGFAKSLIDSLDGSVPMNSNPWRRGAFVVLKAPEVPSVLLELGYLSSEEDEALFRNETWQQSVAETAARAIEKFFGVDVAAGQERSSVIQSPQAEAGFVR